jgi:hypothetical protein
LARLSRRDAKLRQTHIPLKHGSERVGWHGCGRIRGVQHLPARVYFLLDVVRRVRVIDASLVPRIVHLTDDQIGLVSN